MNTRVIMLSSAIILGAFGIILTFLPAEVLTSLGLAGGKPLVLVFQILGALFFGFAMLNWMSQWSAIGGIYNKPVSIANFSQFFIGAMALLKQLIADPTLPKVLWIIAVVYGFYALVFGWLFYSGKGSSQPQK